MGSTERGWCEDRSRFDETVFSLEADMVNAACISRVSGISMQVLRECGTPRPLHKATMPKLEAALPELERIRSLPVAERLAEVGGGYVDPSWFDATVASLRKRGLTDTYISRKSGLTTQTLHRCGDPSRRLYASAVAKLANALDALEATAAMPEPSKSIEMGTVWELVCPQCGRRFSPASPDDLLCSDECRDALAAGEPAAEVPINHNTSLGKPSATAYAKGCRCTACAAAQNVSANKVRAKKGAVWGNATLARKCIRVLLENGWTLSELHRTTGIRPRTLADIRDGHTTRVKVATANALFEAVSRPRHKPAPCTDVDAAPLRELLARWKSHGIPASHVAKVANVSTKTLSAVMTGKSTKVKAVTAAKVLAKRKDFDHLAALPADERRMEMRGTLHKKRCAQCGRTFHASNPKQRYCSEQCKWDFHNRRTSHDPSPARKALSNAKERGISLAALAEKHGIDRYALYRIANGETTYVTDGLWHRMQPLLEELRSMLT